MRLRSAQKEQTMSAAEEVNLDSNPSETPSNNDDGGDKPNDKTTKTVSTSHVDCATQRKTLCKFLCDIA